MSACRWTTTANGSAPTLAEPLDAITNAAFLIASTALLWQLAKATPRPPVAAWILPGLLGLVGLCSLSFHTFATEFTGALDTLSILALILTAVVLIVRSGWNVPWRWAWLAAPAYLVAAFALNTLLQAIGGDKATLGGYIPAFVGLAGFGLVLRARELNLAAAVFAVSLTLRTLDDPLCGSFPAGTHFLWHCLNAIVCTW
ncbi:MAG TPA: hypothetical protein DGT23_27180 [Micromonosporaceae bacterium]|nr:hypothetical protein [Micromonosporaceae bacterium]